MRLLAEFERFEKEQQLVGRMLMAYGEFEFTIAQLLGYAIPGGDDTAARLLYRVNGEAARLDVADALLRPFFETTLRIAGAWTNTWARSGTVKTSAINMPIATGITPRPSRWDYVF